MTHKSIHLHLSLSRATGIVRECPTSITYNVVLLQLSLTKIKAVFRNVNTLQKAVERPTEMTNTQAGGQKNLVQPNGNTSNEKTLAMLLV